MPHATSSSSPRLRAPFGRLLGICRGSGLLPNQQFDPVYGIENPGGCTNRKPARRTPTEKVVAGHILNLCDRCPPPTSPRKAWSSKKYTTESCHFSPKMPVYRINNKILITTPTATSSSTLFLRGLGEISTPPSRRGPRSRNH